MTAERDQVPRDAAPMVRLRPVNRLQEIKGIRFPAAVRFRQLIVTGPPGCGKSTLIRALGGWPEEGYVDLTREDWWRSRVMSFRPREVHLGLPFLGVGEGLALFEEDWRSADPPLELEIERVRVPPVGRSWSPLSWQRRYVFEFLLPPAMQVFAARRQRAYLQTHPVDEGLALDEVRRQIELHALVAEHLHKSGLQVYVRDAFDGDPKVFSEPRGVLVKPRKRLMAAFEERLRGGLERLSGIEDSPVLESLDEIRLEGTKARLSLSLLPVEITLGPQKLHAHLERPLAEPERPWPSRVVLTDPVRQACGVGGFVRLEAGQRTRIGKGEEDRQISLDLPRDILPRLEMANEGEALAIIDLHSPSGTGVRAIAPGEMEDPVAGRRQRLRRVGEIFGGSLRQLAPETALQLLSEVNEILEEGPFRARDSHGKPGGLLEIPAEVTPIIVGDLHASLDNLLKILSENRFLDEMESGRSAMILLGDAVHHEDEDLLEEMDSSILMMDLLFSLMRTFPTSFFYLRGNHDSFSHEVTKEGVPQGHVWRRKLRDRRGDEYLQRMQRFYDLLPYVVVSGDFVACHAGPPTEATSRQRLIDVRRNERLMHQLTWNRIKRPNKPAGYTQREIRALRRSLDLPPDSCFLVSHNPQPEGGPIWTDLGGIRNHHLIYSARFDLTSVMTRVGGEMVPLVYPTEPLLRLLA